VIHLGPVLRRALWAVLALAAVASVARGFVNAMEVSIDFQWSAARVLLSGDDPYLVDALGDPEGRLDSAVHYGHLLYVMKLPLALLELADARLVWAVANLIMAVTAVEVLRRAFVLRREQTLLLLSVFLASEPLRLTIGNAQTPLIVLLFASLLALPERRHLTLLSGVSYVKWSFAPPFALFVLIRRGWRGALLWAVPALVGMAVFASFTQDLRPLSLLRPLLRQAGGPRGVADGTADVMTLMGLLGVDGPARTLLPLLLMTVASVMVVRSFRTDRHAIAALAIVSLVTVNHLPYDFVLLLPAFAASLAASRGWQRVALMSASLYFFFLAFLRRAIASAVAVAPFDRDPARALAALRSVGPTWPPQVDSSVVGILVLLVAVLALHSLDRQATDVGS